MGFQYSVVRLKEGDPGFEEWGPEQVGICKVFDLLVPLKRTGIRSFTTHVPYAEIDGIPCVSSNWAMWENQNLLYLLSMMNMELWKKYPILG